MRLEEQRPSGLVEFCLTLGALLSYSYNAFYWGHKGMNCMHVRLYFIIDQIAVIVTWWITAAFLFFAQTINSTGQWNQLSQAVKSQTLCNTLLFLSNTEGYTGIQSSDSKNQNEQTCQTFLSSFLIHVMGFRTVGATITRQYNCCHIYDNKMNHFNVSFCTGSVNILCSLPEESDWYVNKSFIEEPSFTEVPAASQA